VVAETIIQSMNTAFNRLTTLKRIIPATVSKMSTSSSVAAARSDDTGEAAKRIPTRDLKIDSTYMMKSGYEIPVLGFGVSPFFRYLSLFIASVTGSVICS